MNIPDSHGRSTLDHANAALLFAMRLCLFIEQHFLTLFGIVASDIESVLFANYLRNKHNNSLTADDLRNVGPGGWRCFSQRMWTTDTEIVSILKSAGAQAHSPYEVAAVAHVDDAE